MKSITIIVICIFLLACAEPTDIKKEDAEVNRIQGLYIFVLSEPKSEYEVLGTITNDAITDAANATKGKKFGQALADIFSSVSTNADFSKLIAKKAEEVSAAFPEADGIIFEQNLSKGTVIEFE